MNKGTISLLLTAFIWGFCLVGQSSSMEVMGPLSFSAVRLTLGGLSMLPLCMVLDKLKKRKNMEYKPLLEYKTALKMSFISTPAIFISIWLQQSGLVYTGVGKCAFISAFYIFMVPIIGVFMGKKPSLKLSISVLVALIGLYLITMSEGIGNINKGDILCFANAVAYSVYLIIIEKIVGLVDSIKLSMFQFTFCGLGFFIPAIIFEPGQISWENYVECFWEIIVTGVVSCALGYTLEIIGQAYTEASKASMILSSETIFSLIAGMIFLGEILTVKEYIGCAIMAAAIVAAVLPDRKMLKSNEVRKED